MTDIKPLVSVIMCVHNALKLTIECLDSIRGLDRVGEIIVIDDFSDREVSDVLKNINGIEYFRNTGNEGFVRSNNRAAKKAKYDYLLFLNSDTRATVGQPIKAMAEDLDMGYAVVGARLVYPTGHPRQGTIQHAGVGFNKNSIPYHVYDGLPGDEPVVMIRREVNAVTGACLMTSRKWWDKIGGFDSHLEPACYEDILYSLLVKRAGGQILYEPSAEWFHWQHGSQTNSTGWFTRENLDKNLMYIFQKVGAPVCDDSIYYNLMGRG